MKIPSRVRFIDDQLEQEFNRLPDEDVTKKALIKAIKDIREDCKSGEYIPKDRIPKSLKKIGINNLRIYDLPSAWRLFYTLINNEIGIISIILKWTNHKDYERLFN